MDSNDHSKPKCSYRNTIYGKTKQNIVYHVVGRPCNKGGYNITRERYEAIYESSGRSTATSNWEGHEKRCNMNTIIEALEAWDKM